MMRNRGVRLDRGERREEGSAPLTWRACRADDDDGNKRRRGAASVSWACSCCPEKFHKNAAMKGAGSLTLKK